VKPPEFTHNITLPCLGENIKIRELPNKFYKNILKYIQHGNNNILSAYFINIVEYLCIDFKDIHLLNKVDVFYILLFARYVCVTPDLKLDFECKVTKKPYTLNIDIPSILAAMDDNMYPESVKEIELNYGIKIKIGIPNNILTVESILDVAILCLQEVVIGDTIYRLHGFTFDERKSVTDNIPGDILPSVLRFITSDVNTFNSIPVVNNKSPHVSDAEGAVFNLNLFDNSMFEFLHLIYSDSLQNYFYTTYILVSKLHFDSNLIRDLTPVECNVYLRRYIEEIDQKNTEIKKQNAAGAMPMPDTIGAGNDPLAF